MKTLAIVVLVLFGPAVESGESPARSLMERAHILARSVVHQHVIATFLYQS